MASKSKKTAASNRRQLSLLTLPDVCHDKILSFLTFDEVANLRQSCKYFNQICQKRLNKGFLDVEKYHMQCLKKVKSQLPRRESERRNHPLSRHSDILTAVETRLSLLNMTFMKYIENSICCFIPGKVIDEVYRILRYIETTSSPSRTHEILQELRDISSMAMEHFDEKIVPTFKGHGIQYLKCGSTTISFLPSQIKMKHTLDDVEAAKETMTAVAKRQLKPIQAKMSSLLVKMADVQKVMLEQNNKIEELNRRCLEYDQKLADVQDVISHGPEQVHKCQDEVQPGPSNSKATTRKKEKVPARTTRAVKRKAEESSTPSKRNRSQL